MPQDSSALLQIFGIPLIPGPAPPAGPDGPHTSYGTITRALNCRPGSLYAPLSADCPPTVAAGKPGEENRWQTGRLLTDSRLIADRPVCLLFSIQISSNGLQAISKPGSPAEPIRKSGPLGRRWLTNLRPWPT